ncbi:hypothetical protein P171DRAFT_176510 [Karstenula rhodostoma CBS 690.94]|uniref:SWIM-type domain-containing protein n=1 Tax=Karstenula rhodostoma CBS 690.94 TaxID=1392251 RepID=A0A9P4P417_9PLEO|nr:hypothetical protein P171DRAFT_176510 [Karstenula rhodostoma CBS 690.94]
MCRRHYECKCGCDSTTGLMKDQCDHLQASFERLWALRVHVGEVWRYLRTHSEIAVNVDGDSAELDTYCAILRIPHADQGPSLHTWQQRRPCLRYQSALRAVIFFSSLPCSVCRRPNALKLSGCFLAVVCVTGSDRGQSRHGNGGRLPLYSPITAGQDKRVRAGAPENLVRQGC